jgi:hypothetical protein
MDNRARDNIDLCMQQYSALPALEKPIVIANHNSVKSVMAGFRADVDQSLNQYAQQPAPEPGV